MDAESTVQVIVHLFFYTFNICAKIKTYLLQGKRVSFEGEQGPLPLRRLPSVPILSQVLLIAVLVIS